MSTNGVRSNNAEPVVVVGAGVSGLTTAICLAEAGARVQVWAAEPPPQTTSIVAGALWGPAFQEPASQTLAWMAQSLRDFQELAKVPDTGVRLAPVLAVGELANVDELPPQAYLVPDLRRCASAQLPPGFTHGFLATMPLIDMPRYLQYLLDRLSAAGGEIEIRRVRSLTEAAEAAPIVVNCTGLGARELVGDHTVQPLFGQHVVLSNPGLDQVFVEVTEAEEWTCYFPHPQRVVCGGIRVPGRWDRTPLPDVTERILQRCRAIEPRLADAEVVETITGLRPGRPAVRVEVEPVGRARCVHNYGHGGNGVTLSWGCARQAARLVLAPTASRNES
ncbi:FAD-dependent oxidoreductase [Mycobacterium xenopi]|uniref:FAD-dependent oxidoreductase n=1 Tax=Mycobacterium xenopi TaxID=1789 RepID=UPI000A165B62|nr:FAD-dependent oxidoreductase [Mycobacterium xenopi]MDA3640856.1 FAD-dependent oxidoreductase [Mycobacterium xenopi]MDA3656676.1 FAD-dependent oxidoreductase [Mycobacterium xenopi]MDA3661271.1 FAD-dependent oxidoreductase [Mycobacterium xenopi]ORX20209.1 amino acid oxidase [Mycobacterium xenopi]